LSFTPARLLEALDRCLDTAGDPRPSRLCVALSGGLDSTVLLKSLADLRAAGRAAWSLRAVHVDHGLHADSAQWAAHCSAFAAALGVPLDQVRVAAHASKGESPEAVARDARYAALSERMQPNEALLTAHHADDQFETILLQWLRGGGLRAIAGMSPCASIGDRWHLRPMLGFTRDGIEAWARQSGLRWMEDPSNRDTRFDRNYLRLEVLPVIRRRWPAAARTASRAAEYATEALEAEAAVAAADLQQVADGAALSLERLQLLPDARQRAVLRAWLRGLGLPLPSVRTLTALRRDALAAAADRIPAVDWPGAVVHRYRGRLYANARMPRSMRAGEWWPAQGLRHELDASSSLELVADTGVGLSRARLPARLEVVARASGESFHASGAAHRRPLRKWLQEHGVLPWRRASLPLLAAEGEIAAIADLSCAESFAARPGEPSWRVVWHGRPALTEADVLSFNWHGDPPIR
jgi:tRNA(Ile)-lysidine synthase